MTARVLIVDDILANVRLLEAKLAAEYFEVVTAVNGVDALEVVQRVKPDIALLDVMMPGIDGIEVCRRMKANPLTHHIPVIMVTALDQPEDRIRGLEAGADDFLTKPVNDVALFCRIKSLVRLKMLSDELRARAISSEHMGLIPRLALDDDKKPGEVVVVDSRGNFFDRVVSALGSKHHAHWVPNPADIAEFIQKQSGSVELIIISLDADEFDGLRICSQLKAVEETRQIPLLVIAAPDDQQRLLRALDMGVNDYLIRPVDKLELLARVNTQVRRARFTEQLRLNVQASLEMAVTDALTGLYNRRYMETHLAQLTADAVNRSKPLALLSIDVDHFKSINDTHGHEAGDKVLQEIALRIQECVRNADLACRIGGEEFNVILPGTDKASAQRIAERLRRAVCLAPFKIGAGAVNVSVSIGISALEVTLDKGEDILRRADQALYKAKREGRNRVVMLAA